MRNFKKVIKRTMAVIFILMLIVPMFTGTVSAANNEKSLDSGEIKNESLPTTWGTEGEKTSYTVTQSQLIDDRIEVIGDVTLILNDNTELTLSNGIHLIDENSLTIESQSKGENMGKLSATGSGGNAAIGGNAGIGYPQSLLISWGDNCGELTINGGAITLNGLNQSRGFGGGRGGNGQNTFDSRGGNGGSGGILNINGGTCTASCESGAAIGGGTGGSAPIPGNTGKKTEITMDPSMCLLAGEDGEHLTDLKYEEQPYVNFKAGDATVTFSIPNIDPFSKGVIKGTIVDEPQLVDGDKSAVWYTDSDLTNKYDFSQPVTGDFTLYGQWENLKFTYIRRTEQGDLVEETKEFTLDYVINENTFDISPFLGTDDSETWYAIKKSCIINKRITIKGNVNLILLDGANFKVPKGICLQEGNSLTVFSQSQTQDKMGKIIATGQDGNAAIGGNYGDLMTKNVCGTLNLHGGVITTTGLGNSRAFGGGENRSVAGGGGNLVILGGIFTASAATGPAISGGSGWDAWGEKTDITMYSWMGVRAGNDNQHLIDREYTDQQSAMFGQTMTVTFNIPGKDTFTDITLIDTPVNNPILVDGEKSAIWYTDSDLTKEYDFTQPVTENLNLYGDWTTFTYTYTCIDSKGEPTQVTKNFTKEFIICKDHQLNSCGTEDEETWYIVTQSCSDIDRMNIKGNVNLILLDDVKFELPKGIRLIDKNSLTVFSQSHTNNKMGQIVATGKLGHAAIGGDAGYYERECGHDGDNCGTLTINGGMIIANGFNDSRGIGGGRGSDTDYWMAHPGYGGNGGNLTILDGVCIAYSENGAAIGGGTHGYNEDIPSRDGKPTTISLDAKIKVSAGTDEKHATDTEYTNQAYACFEKPHVHNIDDQEIIFIRWTSDNSLPRDPGNYYLATDVTLSDTYSIPMDNASINLCLNGHVINQSADKKRCFSIGSRSTLNLYDCNGDDCIHNGYIDSDGLWHLGEGEGTAKSITGGVITGSNEGGTYIFNGGHFNMYGGTIAGNKSNSSGGAVHSDGVFNMYGGELCNNTALNGGAIYTVSAYTNLYDGTISYNKATYGGGVMTNSGNALFSIYGGTICNNKATYGGGVDINYGKFNMHGGTICNNSATYGGGAYTNTAILGGSGVIQNNTNSNLLVVSGSLIDLGTGDNGVEVPTKDMKIGVTLGSGTGTFTKECSDYSSNFISDNINYEVKFVTDHLELTTAAKYNVIDGMTKDAHGKIEFNKKSAVAGDTIKVTVKPDEGYILKSLKYNDGNRDYDITKEKSFIMPKGNVTVKAIFIPSEFILGDGNDNGHIDISDTTAIQFLLAQIINDDGFISQRVNIHKDDKYSIDDATVIQQFLAHLATDYDNVIGTKQKYIQK